MSEHPETRSDEPGPGVGAVAGQLGSTRFSDVRHLGEVDSTNRYLLDEARDGRPEGLVVVADHQTAGRGRMGRTWTAPPGSALLVSVLLRPELPAEQVHLVTMAAGLSMCDGVFMAAGFNPSLKWPNDLVVGMRKLGGMLSEVVMTRDHVEAVVVGVGVNLDWPELPPDLVDTATSCNLVSGTAPDRWELLGSFLRRFDDRYGSLMRPTGAAAVLGEYRQRCSTIGGAVRVEIASEVIEGVVEGVDDDGRLMVRRADGSMLPVSVGDVVHVRRVSRA